MHLLYDKAMVTRLRALLAPGVILSTQLTGLAAKLAEKDISPWIKRGAIPIVAATILVLSFIVVARKLATPFRMRSIF